MVGDIDAAGGDDVVPAFEVVDFVGENVDAVEKRRGRRVGLLDGLDRLRRTQLTALRQQRTVNEGFGLGGLGGPCLRRTDGHQDHAQ